MRVQQPALCGDASGGRGHTEAEAEAAEQAEAEAEAAEQAEAEAAEQRPRRRRRRGGWRRAPGAAVRRGTAPGGAWRSTAG